MEYARIGSLTGRVCVCCGHHQASPHDTNHAGQTTVHLPARHRHRHRAKKPYYLRPADVVDQQNWNKPLQQHCCSYFSSILCGGRRQCSMMFVSFHVWTERVERSLLVRRPVGVVYVFFTFFAYLSTRQLGVGAVRMSCCLLVCVVRQR